MNGTGLTKRVAGLESIVREVEQARYLRELDGCDLLLHCWLFDMGAVREPDAAARARNRLEPDAPLPGDAETAIGAAMAAATDREVKTWLTAMMVEHWRDPRVREWFALPGGESKVAASLREVLGEPDLSDAAALDRVAAVADECWEQALSRAAAAQGITVVELVGRDR